MIEGRAVVLRNIREKDLAEHFELGSRVAEAGEFWPLTIFNEVTLRKRYDENGMWSDDFGLMLVCDRQGDKKGFIVCFRPVHFMAGYEIGARIYRPADRGRQYMTEAVRLFTSYLFGLHPVPRLQATIAVENTPSRRVAEKCGFRFEGVLRSYAFARGRHIDACMYSLLRDECPSFDEVLRELGPAG